MSHVALDASAFPHIIDNILFNVIAADADAAFTLRAVCRGWRHEVYKSLFYHIAFLRGLKPGLRVMNGARPTRVILPYADVSPTGLWVGMKDAAPYVKVVDCSPQLDLDALLLDTPFAPHTYRLDDDCIYDEDPGWQAAPIYPPKDEDSTITVHMFDNMPIEEECPLLKHIWQRPGLKHAYWLHPCEDSLDVERVDGALFSLLTHCPIPVTYVGLELQHEMRRTDLEQGWESIKPRNLDDVARYVAEKPEEASVVIEELQSGPAFMSIKEYYKAFGKDSFLTPMNRTLTWRTMNWDYHRSDDEHFSD
jgi:hypothetical protein